MDIAANSIKSVDIKDLRETADQNQTGAVQLGITDAQNLCEQSVHVVTRLSFA
jgi:hypothetical protein